MHYHIRRKYCSAAPPTATPRSTVMRSPPDLALFAAALLASCIAALVIRRLLWRSVSFRAQSASVRFELVRRVLNALWSAMLGVAHVCILLRPRLHASDSLYGYTQFAHRIFILTLAAYAGDTLLLSVHPSPPHFYSPFLVHHMVAIVLLMWVVTSLQACAAPTSVFLISAISYVVNDSRHVLTALGYRNASLHTALRALLPPTSLLTAVLPPPLLVVRSAQQRAVPLTTFMLSHMRAYCWAVFLLFFLPHCFIPLHHTYSVYTNWLRRPRPLRTKDM